MRLKKNFYKSLDLYIGIWALITSFTVFNETMFGSYVKNPDIKVRANLTFNLNYLI